MKLSELFVTVKESRGDTEYDMMNNMSKDERDWWDKMDATTKRFALTWVQRATRSCKSPSPRVTY